MDMRLNRYYRIIILTFITGMSGSFAFGFSLLPYHLPPVFIIIALWVFTLAKTRFELILFIACYHALSARSLMFGYSSLFDATLVTGVGFVILVSFIFATTIGLLSFNKNKFIQLLLINFLWCLPFLIVGWASPIFAAGYFMPNFHWLGIILFVPLVYGITIIQWGYQILALIIIFGITFIPTYNKSLTVTAINTHFQNNLVDNPYRIYQKVFATFSSLARKNTTHLAILPEDALPCFDDHLEKISVKEMNQIPTPYVLAGAEICLKTQRKSGVVLLDKETTRFIYTQRQPMSWSMYIPFLSDYSVNWLNNGIIDLKGKRYGLFVCFETVLGWTYLQTLIYKPDTLLSFNSIYWDETGQVEIIQDQLMYSMARLFGIQYQGVWNA